jgi:UDP-2-acetamido-2-deoxy-ribo-hexuluronate aminotransferase
VATAEAVVLAGATPVFVDVEADTANLDPALLEAAITPRTKAVMPVSLYGQMADLAAIRAVAGRHGIAVVEDAAQSLGAVYTGAGGQREFSGAASTIGCTSFFPSKPLGCYGDGGALFTNDASLAEAARQIRVHGQSRRYHHVRVGVGGRMDTLQCAVLLAKLTRFDAELAAREAAARRYSAALGDIGGLQLPVLRPGHRSAWAQYTVRIEAGAAARAHVQAALREAGVPTAVHYPTPLHHQPAYAAYCCPGCCPVSQALADRVLSLPMSADLAIADQDRVGAALAQAMAAVNG